MLLNYLTAQFLNHGAFAAQAKLQTEELDDLISRQMTPNASYILDGQFHIQSFVRTHVENTQYRFHRKGHINWIETVKTNQIKNQIQAIEYFAVEFTRAKNGFFGSEHGQALLEICPELHEKFDPQHMDTSWQYFTQGVFGVCTKDGLPNTIFLKQVCVSFIDKIIMLRPDQVNEATRTILAQTVDLLDKVAADFAPHEVEFSSRQRCINNVRSQFGLSVENTKVIA